MNVLGVKGPRQMSVIVPGMDARQSREDFVQHASNDTLSQAWKKILANMKSSSSANSTESNVSPTLLTSSSSNQQHSQAVATSPKASSKKTTSSSFSSNSSSSSSKLSSLKRSLFHLNRTQSVEKQNEQTTTTQQQRNSKGEIQQPQQQQQQQMRNVVKLVNKSPEWHKGLSSFALDFHGRVTMASVKNFQIVHEANPDYVVMQFGKVNKDLYTCDYSYPFCALQAFALAITSLDNKLGCD